MYITQNKIKHFVYYYWFFGWYYINNYMRNDIIKYLFMENMILNFWKVITNAPSFNKPHIVYRFIKNDEY